MNSISLKLLAFLTCLTLMAGAAQAQPAFNKTIGGTVFGSIPLVDTLPEMQLGIGGGMYFDYRFNQRFSLMTEAFFTTQNGKGRSNGEGSIEMLAIPTVTFKMYLLNDATRIDPYIGLGLGIYYLTEGSFANATSGFGMGAQIEVGLDVLIADNLVGSFGGTYRSIGLINSFSGRANATTIMPYTLFGRIGYRF